MSGNCVDLCQSGKKVGNKVKFVLQFSRLEIQNPKILYFKM